MASTTTEHGFRQIQSFKLGYAEREITQYVSERSQMRVVVVNGRGPKVNGYFALGTEVFDDSGAPHILEHLVFAGSHKFPFKSLLFRLASRLLSQLNAITHTDCTVYELESAGLEAFEKILPVFLDHILSPKIAEEAITTDVWHIDGSGNDAGVVYSEMQADQTDPSEIMTLEANRLLYPKDVGFRYQTGGMLDALRVLEPQKIRQFHKDMYQPCNLCLVIIGEVHPQNLLQVLGTFEENMKSDIAPIEHKFKRPWIDSVQPPPLKEIVVKTVNFPHEDESVGRILVELFGPKCIDLIEFSAADVFLTYLFGSKASVVNNILVEKERIASSVEFQLLARPNSVITIELKGVATEMLKAVEQRLFEVLLDVVSNPLELDVMRECIRQKKRRDEFNAESDDSFFAERIITDYLYGKRDGSTLEKLETLGHFKILEELTDEKWRGSMRKWLVDMPHISILGEPSSEMAQNMNVVEKSRIAKRKEDLGEDGLAKLATCLEDAERRNAEPIPDDLMDQWSIPSARSIRLIESDTAGSGMARSVYVGDGLAQKMVDSAVECKLPLFIQFEDVPSEFVHIHIHVGTSEVPVGLKRLISTFTNNFFGTIGRDGHQFDVQRDSIYHSFESSSAFGDADGLMMRFLAKREKYSAAIELLQTLMFDSIFDPHHLQVSISNTLDGTWEATRDGYSMAREISASIHEDKTSLSVADGYLRKTDFLKQVEEQFNTEPELIIRWFEIIRKSLFTFQNMRILVIANLPTLENPISDWDALAKRLTLRTEMVPIPKPIDLLSGEGRKPGSVGAIITRIPALGSSYSVSTAQGITSRFDSQFPAILVAMQYLIIQEGPLWNAVRGGGYAYCSFFSTDFTSGRLSYYVRDSPDVSRAIIASRDTIHKVAHGEIPIEKHLLEAAISQIVFTSVEERETMDSAALRNFIDGVVLGLPKDWDMLNRVQDVKEDEIQRAMREFLLPCFVPGRSNVVVTCDDSMSDDIENGVRQMGYRVRTRELSDFQTGAVDWSLYRND